MDIGPPSPGMTRSRAAYGSRPLKTAGKAQFGGAAAGIAGRFLRLGGEWFAGQPLQTGILQKGVFHQAILQRVEADNPENPPWQQPVRPLLQEGGEGLQLPVDHHAQRLKGAGGRVDTAMALPGKVGAGNGGCQIRGIGKGAAGHQAAGNAPGAAVFPVGANQGGQFRFAEPLQQLACRFPRPLIHAHVHRSGLAQTETPLRLLQLRAAYPQIRQNPAEALLGWGLMAGEVAVVDSPTACKGGQGHGGSPASIGIPIKARESAVGMGRQQKAAVAGAANGAIQQVFRLGHGGKTGQHLLGEHGLMAIGLRWACGHGRRLPGPDGGVPGLRAGGTGRCHTFKGCRG